MKIGHSDEGVPAKPGPAASRFWPSPGANARSDLFVLARPMARFGFLLARRLFR